MVPAAAVQMGNEALCVGAERRKPTSAEAGKIGIQDMAPKRGDQRCGLSAGDRVVTDGIDRLTEGAKVEGR